MTVPPPDRRAQTELLEQLIAAARPSFRTAEESAASVIRSCIVAGVFQPGERLAQDRLAHLLDVSRMPIRSALRQLESEGLVEVHAHRGATVRSLSPEEISDLYEMRILIETFALRKTVMAIDDGEIDRLEALITEAEASEAPEVWLESRNDFYRSLYSIGNTPRVVSTIMQFRREVSRYMTGLADLRSHAHRDLLERVRLRDPDLASAWLEVHLRQVAQELRGQLAARSREQ